MNFIDFIVYPLVYIIFMPILTTIHELGHAIPALIFTNSEVIINIGNSNCKKQININRLVINVNGYKSLTDVSYGYINWKPIDSKLKSIIITAGGPASSLFTSLLLFLYLNKTNISYLPMIIFNAIFMLSIGQFILTSLPIKYTVRPHKGLTSDGYKILQWLKIADYNK